MKKKLLASLLALVLVLGMLPLTALAVDAPTGVTVTPSGTWSEVGGVNVYTAEGHLSLAQSGTDNVEGNKKFQFGYYPKIDVKPGDAKYVILSRGQNGNAFDQTVLDALLTAAETANKFPFSQGTDSLANWFQVYATTGKDAWTEEDCTYWPNSANAPITNIVLAKAGDGGAYTYTKYKFDFSACEIEMPFTTVVGAEGTVLGKTITDVQDEIAATLETTLKDKTIEVSGACKWVDSWTEAGFPTNTGNYVALKFTPKANVKTIQVQLSDGTWKTLDTDNTLVWQFNADHDNTTVPMKVTFGDQTNTGATVNYTLDLSGVDAATKPPLEVVPANLTTAAGKEAPGYGHVGTYTATIDNDAKTIAVKAVDLQKTTNTATPPAEAYWVGIGLTQQAGATYATGWGTPGTIADDAYEAADSSQVVDGKTYDTMYWGATTADKWNTSKTGWVSVKVGDDVETYTVNFDVKVLDDTALLGSEMTLTKMGAVGSDGRFNYLLRADRFAKIETAEITITDSASNVIVKYPIDWSEDVETMAEKGGLGFEWSLRELQLGDDGYSVTGAEATEWEANNSNVVPAGTYTVTVEATTPAQDGTATTKTYTYSITITEAMRKDVMVERTVTSTVADGKTATVTCSPAKLYGGETVTVNVTDIQYGYELDKIEVDGTAITGTTFTMPADSNAAVTVTLKKAPLPDATLQYTAVADTTIVSDCAPDTMWLTFKQGLPRNTHLWFVITNDKNNNKYEIAADSSDSADTTVKFAWSFQNKGQFEKWAKGEGDTDVDLGSTPGATYTVKGYVLDAAGTNTTDVTGKEAFAAWTVKVPEAKVEAPGKTVVDASELPEGMSEPDVAAATNAAASVAVDATSKTVLTTAANEVVSDVIVGGTPEEIAAAKTTALDDVELEIAGETKIVYVPALKVTPKDYTTDEETGAKTLEVDITAVLNAVVTAESTNVNDIKIKVDADDDTAGTNAAIVDSQELTISTSITLTITLPNGFVTPDQNGTIYVLHKGHYHPGTYTTSDKKLTFTSTDGLSPFVISTSASPAAKIGDTYYDTLQDAVNAVKNGEQITLITASAADETVTVSGTTRTFTIAAGTSGVAVAQVKAAISSATGDDFPLTVTYTAGGGGGGGGGSSATVIVSSVTGGKVSVSDSNAKKGDTVTITTTPNTGKKVDTVTVTDEKGSKIAVTDAGNGKYTFVMPDGKVTVKVTFADDPAAGKTVFTDVPADAYYADAVAWAVDKGITNGTSADTFSPESPCTRAQIVTFLWRAAGSPKAAGSNPFTDVAADAYYYDAVLWAVGKGITNGTSETTFSPDNTCTRGQTVTFLYRYAGQPQAAGSNPFADVAAGEYYTNAVLWAVEKGITNGTSADTFSPENTCTRGQIVTFLYRDLAE